MVQHFLMRPESRGLGIDDVLALSNDEATAIWRRLRWPQTDGEPICPHCGCHRCWTCRSRPRFRGKACRADFTITSGTLLHSRKRSLKQHLVAIMLFVSAVKGIAALQAGRIFQVSYKSVFVLEHKLREAMAGDVLRATVGGEGAEVEVDGCYVGGHVRPANHRKNRRDRRLQRNQSGKRRVVVIARQRGGPIIAETFWSEDAAVPWICRHVAPETIIHADEAPAWNDLHAHFKVNRICHRDAYSTPEACTNWAECFFSRLRRAEYGQHHHISGPYLLRYTLEAVWRETYRREGVLRQFERLAGAVINSMRSVVFGGYWQRHRKI